MPSLSRTVTFPDCALALTAKFSDQGSSYSSVARILTLLPRTRNRTEESDNEIPRWLDDKSLCAIEGVW